ncbi:MAG: RNA polymerase Rpb6 [Candidatus Neomarinimicrobiota bacterium]
MAVEPISIRQMEKQTADVYEAVVVMSQRAKQVAQNRVAEKALYEMEELVSNDMDIMMDDDEISRNYEEKEKATTVAINEFMTGKLTWRKIEEETLFF